MNLTAIVVTFNRLGKLQTTINNLLAQELNHIVVVNNASVDDTGSWLAALSDPRIQVVTLAENKGGAGGFEAGMAFARDTIDPDWVVLMDDDAFPYPEAIAQFRMKVSALDPNVGCVAAAVFHPDGKLCEMNRPSRNPFWSFKIFANAVFHRGRVGFHIKDDDFEETAYNRPIDVASFVGYFVNRNAIELAGLPEGGLFIYGDDVLYSLRLRRANVGMVLMPSVRFIHDCTTMDEGFIYRPLWKIYYHCRNGVSIAWHAAGPFIFPFALLYYSLVWWRRGKHYKEAEKPLYRKMMWAGIRDGLLRKRGRNDAIHTLAVALEQKTL